MLNFNDIGTGPANAPALLIAHGLYGSARNWGVISKRLSDTRRVITVDMRNHGDSPHLPTNSYEDMAQDLAGVIEHIGGPVDLLGHSMGGKTAMTLALTRPELLRSLIVADIAPVSYTHSQLPNILAMKSVDLTAVTRRSDAGAQLATAGVDPAVQPFLLQSLDVKEKRWKLNLNVLEAEMPKIMSFPALQSTFEQPTLFLSGATSDYVKREDRDHIKSLFPKSRFAKIPDAGHWLHAEQPRAFEAAVRTYLDAVQNA
ncbi:alpha/beta fold hydrolase [Ascidiaceihabitans sp.]|uniref:alpha/beta fold hydrolase n=1 Tax=Ascidiaceihabitans sp. TaxID=1872644 RepID=UPI00329A1D79